MSLEWFFSYLAGSYVNQRAQHNDTQQGVSSNNTRILWKTTHQFGANIKFHVRIIVIVTIIITIALFASQQIKKKLAFIFYGFWRSQLCVFIEIAKWYSEYLHPYLSFIIICDAFRLKWR